MQQYTSNITQIKTRTAPAIKKGCIASKGFVRGDAQDDDVRTPACLAYAYKLKKRGA
jgi:hypothetical protein